MSCNRRTGKTPQRTTSPDASSPATGKVGPVSPREHWISSLRERSLRSLLQISSYLRPRSEQSERSRPEGSLTKPHEDGLINEGYRIATSMSEVLAETGCPIKASSWACALQTIRWRPLHINPWQRGNRGHAILRLAAPFGKGEKHDAAVRGEPAPIECGSYFFRAMAGKVKVRGLSLVMAACEQWRARIALRGWL